MANAIRSLINESAPNSGSSFYDRRNLQDVLKLKLDPVFFKSFKISAHYPDLNFNIHSLHHDISQLVVFCPPLQAQFKSGFSLACVLCLAPSTTVGWDTTVVKTNHSPWTAIHIYWHGEETLLATSKNVEGQCMVMLQGLIIIRLQISYICGKKYISAILGIIWLFASELFECGKCVISTQYNLHHITVAWSD